MKLEKYVDKNEKKRKVILISISTIVLISISFLLYKTFASFTESAEFPIMNGKVDYFGNSDIYFVFYQGDKQLDEMPQKDNEENLVFANGECDNEASIVWDSEAWGPIVKNLNKSKTKCSLYFEEKNLMADLTLTSCDNHITATAIGVEGVQITKYEYKIDEGEWFTGSETQEFNDQTVGDHTIKLRVTNDNNEVSKEVKRSITINEQRKVEIYGKQIPIATCNNGLYEVSHDVSEISSDWNKTEYRFAGVNYENDTTAYVHNYVRFNNEIWRIIGLVNVKTESGIEQRLKIVRTDGVGEQKNLGRYTWSKEGLAENWSAYNNNWATSSLKDMLNGIYYESSSGECYIADRNMNESQSNCDFTGNGEQPKGLDEIAMSMIDKEEIWNIGAGNSEPTTKEFYEKERGNKSYEERYTNEYYPTEWSNETDVGGKHNGIGLIYPSDYGYATNGGNIGRETCFSKELSNWNETDGNYQSECAKRDWLNPSYSKGKGENLLTLMPDLAFNTDDYHILTRGQVLSGTFGGWVTPAVYLTTSTTITSGDGTINNPYILS